jgi:hypothetical protein
MNIVYLVKQVVSEVYKKKIPFDDVIFHYRKYKSLEGIAIPNMTDNQNWLFNQLLQICDELRSNKIDTPEILNTDNWGYKPTGNLGIFDIGFGDYFDEFKEEPEHLELNENSTILDKILNKIGVNNSSFLGKGMFGVAHDIGNNKVLKLTKDKSEAINSNKIKGEKMKHIADIYDVKKFQIEDREYFLIILEKLKVDDGLTNIYEELKKLFEDFRNMHIDKSVIDKIKIKHPVVGEFLKDLSEIGYKEAWTKHREEIIKLEKEDSETYDFNQIAGIAEWIKDSKLNSNMINVSPPEYIEGVLSKFTK